jgi:SulP family sulfate permease
VAQGCANLLSPLLLGLPVTGVIARTSTNIRAGAVTPIAGIVHSLCILVFVLFLGPLVGQVPLACLAGILLMVCWHMAELRHWPHILKAHQGDALLLPLTFLLTVAVGLTYAVTIGVVLGMLFFIRRSSDSVRIDRMDASEAESHPSLSLPGVLVYEVQGPFFFGAATLIRDLQGTLDRSSSALVLRLEQVPFIDATAGFALRELLASCGKLGIRCVLCGLQARSSADLQRLGLTGIIGTENLFATLHQALDAVGTARETTPSTTAR